MSSLRLRYRFHRRVDELGWFSSSVLALLQEARFGEVRAEDLSPTMRKMLS